LAPRPDRALEDDVSVSLLPAAVFLAITVVGLLALRPFPGRVRVVFDTLCFLAFSLFFFSRKAFPIFPPLRGTVNSEGLWLRAIGGCWWLLGARLVVAALASLQQRIGSSRGARLFSDLLAGMIYVATAGVVLNSVFALPVTGVVATSGVVAIVLGLALQNTLADVFSGIAVGIEAPFGVGDRLQIADKIEGQVVQMNWRSVRVQTDGDDVAIIPNSIIAKSEIINRSYPSQRRAASVEISCPQGAAPERVIEGLIHATMLCPHIQRAPAPTAVLAQLGMRRHTYRISFVVDGTDALSSTKDLLLRSARRQLHYAGFLDQDSEAGKSGLEAAGAALIARRLLHDLTLFDCLAPGQIDGLAEHLEERQLEPKDVLFAQGAVDRSLYIVASGVLEVVREVGSASETIGCIGAGDYIGEVSLLTDAPHAASLVALTHCQVLRLPREAITPLLSENPGLAVALDRSARRGLDMLNRGVAARAAPDIGAKGQFLAAIRSVFHFSLV
jgi:small-conductance mechanosensitive channel/CRP-like cAMP-binding protein